MRTVVFDTEIVLQDFLALGEQQQNAYRFSWKKGRWFGIIYILRYIKRLCLI